VFGVVADAPGVALPDQPVGRLGEECRLGGEVGDARPRGGQLLSSGGDVTGYVGQGRRGVGDLLERSETSGPLVGLAAGFGHGAASLLAASLRGLGGRAQSVALRVGAVDGALGGGVKKTLH
jgi:hypothetical protein